MKHKDTIAYVCGIDAVYFFVQSGAGYDEVYLDILNQIDDQKKAFEALNYQYQDNEIIVTINEIEVKNSGKGRDGYSWFVHEFFRVGFKDPEKNRNLHDIQIQLNSKGIYTVGIQSLINYITTFFLNGMILERRYFPITRIDLNMFIQHDFKYLCKEMIVSKKKNHASKIGECSSGYELETYYVGRKPFMLRIYNKLKELKTASQEKREMMLNYFGVNGLDVSEPIFNVEFEMHREFLKEYGIDTVEDALRRAESLFTLGCDLIKLIDPSSLSEKQLYSNNRRRANVLPIWEFISTHYKIDAFMQISTPLNKIEKFTYNYSLDDARKPLKKLINRLLMHKHIPTLLFFYELLEQTKEEFNYKMQMRKMHMEYTAPVRNSFMEDLKAISNEGLERFREKLDDELSQMDEEAMRGSTHYDDLFQKYQEVHHEMTLRGLKHNPTPLYDVDDEAPF